MHYMTTILLTLAATTFNSVKAGPIPAAMCDVSKELPSLPSGQTNLTIPTDSKPIYIAAGVGTQNYSCNDTEKYTSTGAAATLFDISCPLSAYNASETSGPQTLGHHYFINNPVEGMTGISPVFDFTSDSQKGNPNAFVVTAQTGSISAPDDPVKNVNWLQLAAVPGHGDLAKQVFRLNTVGGQPPASCAPGSEPIVVPYVAIYRFFK